MKNIHLLTTDQPTGLFETNCGLLFSIMNKVRSSDFTCYNLYITSNKEIEKGVETWYLDKFLNKPRNSGGAEYGEKQDVIILTTDSLLIKYGVQAIDDTFLQWFVKNSSCKFVEVKELFSNNGNVFLVIR